MAATHHIINPLSDYANKLEPHVKKRYSEKISCVGIDPMLIPEKTCDSECLPPVESIDVLSFLVLETSYYTKEQFKAFRSLEAYNQLVSGFVSSVKGHKIGDHFIVLGKVKHSQRMNDPLASLWIITNNNGTVLFAHCVGCMAGQGECCSHIASVLFYVEAWNRVNEKLACTQVKCSWLLPAAVKEVPYAPVSDINFTSAKKLRKNLDESINSLPTSCITSSGQGTVTHKRTATTPEATKSKASISVPTVTELNNFYSELNLCKKKSVALSLIYPFSDCFITKSRHIQTIPDLFDKKYLNMEYHNLLEACSNVNIEITEDEIKCVEEDTRTQSQGSSFYRHRAGRIGASISKAASHTNPAQPSQSLIKTICYPNIFKFSTSATEHGCTHEHVAITAYEKVMKQKHINFKVKTCGTFINKEYPWLHATPDFLCSCDCCGAGCGEVKCPYCLKDVDFNDYISKKNSCLKSDNGVTFLHRDHAYYYQTQQQIFTTGYKFCDFVVCGFTGGKQINFFCERILPDINHWNTVLPKINEFWRYCILPEILGRWYTQKRNLPLSSSSIKSVCFCRQESTESVVTCSNESCTISIFHLSCLKVAKVPKKWFCPLCQKTNSVNKNNSKAKQTKELLEEALKLPCICICKEKPIYSDKLLKCHNVACKNGKFFHLTCLNLKRKPNNALTTWQCSGCKSEDKANSSSNTQNMDSDVIITKVSTCSSEKFAPIAKLNEEHFNLVLSPYGWLDCDIIHAVHICLQNVNPEVDGLQRPTLGPVKNFTQVNGEFIQILHTGNSHWVCVGTVGCEDETVNFYDSLYHNVIDSEIEDQVINLVGQDNFNGIRVVPVQQQLNGSDCGVFSAAFATCLAYGISPEMVQFDVSKMRTHLYHSLKLGTLEMFPTLI